MALAYNGALPLTLDHSITMCPFNYVRLSFLAGLSVCCAKLNLLCKEGYD
jgi:hypothetical protein